MQVSDKKAKAQSLTSYVAKMSKEERERLAARLPAVLNPDGHALSINNTLSLSMQSERHDLTIVAGFRQWLGHGRCVRKGECCVGFIAVPMHLKDKAKSDSDPDAKILRFRLVAVFDISQTETAEG